LPKSVIEPHTETRAVRFVVRRKFEVAPCWVHDGVLVGDVRDVELAEKPVPPSGINSRRSSNDVRRLQHAWKD